METTHWLTLIGALLTAGGSVLLLTATMIRGFGRVESGLDSVKTDVREVKRTVNVISTEQRTHGERIARIEGLNEAGRKGPIG